MWFKTLREKGKTPEKNKFHNQTFLELKLERTEKVFQGGEEKEEFGLSSLLD